MCFALETNTLVLEMNAFDGGDECIENAHLNFSHMHNHSYMCVPATFEHNLCQGDSLPKMGGIMLRKSKKYLDGQWHFPLH